MEPTKEQWQKWYAHKSNKEIWIEEQERIEEQDLIDKEEFEENNNL